METKHKNLAQLAQGDPAMAEAIRRALCIVDKDIPLLIQGETGAGKEVFAAAFHGSSQRAAAPFIAVNCAAIPANLIEAELFGYVAGAFTGASLNGAPGKLREANGGTLFLDEIGDMPASLQAVLLRVLETRRVTPLGGGKETALDIAIVCASHRPLRQLVQEGQFRSDLFYRLNGLTVVLPPLRHRHDLPQLCYTLLQEELPGQRIHLAPSTLELLQAYPWPGNVRQLRNVLRVALALKEAGDTLLPEHLPQEFMEDSSDLPPTSRKLRQAEQQWIKATVEHHAGNISATARELGITRTTLYRKLRQEGT